MRITCDLLSKHDDQTLSVCDGAGKAIARLWRQRLSWHCSDGDVQASVIAAEPLVVPSSEISEPVASALARLQRVVAGTGGVVLLENPAAALGVERIMLAAGVRLFAVTTDADMACWDAALNQGIPVFGVRGIISATAVRLDAMSFLSALAYGNVVCEEGLRLTTCEESPQGVDIEAHEAVDVAVIISGGFEAARLQGTTITWRDRGNERYVRLVIRGATGTCWTQPRFVAHQQPGAPGRAHGHH